MPGQGALRLGNLVLPDPPQVRHVPTHQTESFVPSHRQGRRRRMRTICFALQCNHSPRTLAAGMTHRTNGSASG
jgi:hypothetical protein